MNNKDNSGEILRVTREYFDDQIVELITEQVTPCNTGENVEDPIETGGAELKIDDETGKPYWSLWGADWKDGEDMDAGESISLNPDTYPPGTRIVIIEPGPDSKVSREFYAKFGQAAPPA